MLRSCGAPRAPRLYAVHSSRAMAKYSKGICSLSTLTTSFSFHTASVRHVPRNALPGMTQSPSAKKDR